MTAEVDCTELFILEILQILDILIQTNGRSVYLAQEPASTTAISAGVSS